VSFKILFILHIPPPIHGSSIVGEYIKESLVINGAFECSYINLGTSRTIDEIGKNPFRKIFRYLLIIKKVIKELWRSKPDLCCMNITVKGIGFYKDFVIALIVKLCDVKMVYYFHNKGIVTRQNKIFDNFLYRNVFRNADAILLSQYLYYDVKKYIPAKRVSFCPNGISEIKASRKFKKTLVVSSRIKILFLSNLIESKGVFILLDACKILKNKDLLFHCTFVGGVGNVSVDDFRRKVNELCLQDEVSYVGRKFGTEKEQFLSDADIFVHPSYEDCFPLVLLEAMQHSLPVVSTFEGGIKDIVSDGETGFLVQQKDVLALAEKLQILIKNSELRRKMGVKGRLKYEKEFTLYSFENRFKGILTKIIAKNQLR